MSRMHTEGKDRLQLAQQLLMSCLCGYSSKSLVWKEVGRHLWPLLQLVIFHMELFQRLAPRASVKVIVGSLFKGGFLLGGAHALSSSDPNSLLFVVAPVSSIPTCNYT